LELTSLVFDPNALTFIHVILWFKTRQ